MNDDNEVRPGEADAAEDAARGMEPRPNDGSRALARDCVWLHALIVRRGWSPAYTSAAFAAILSAVYRQAGRP